MTTANTTTTELSDNQMEIQTYKSELFSDNPTYFSIDPQTKEINRYSPELCKAFEEAFQSKKPNYEFEQSWGKATIYFNYESKAIYQITLTGGFRTCFRKEKIESKKIKILIKYNENAKSWYLHDDNPPDHWICVIDASGSMSGRLTPLLKNLYDEVIKPLGTESNSNYITFITFDSQSKIIVDPSSNLELKKFKYNQNINFEQIIKNIKPGSSTRLYDTVMESIEIGEDISKMCSSTNLIIVTDGEDNNSSIYNKDQMKSKLEELRKCKNSWNIVMMGVNSFDIENKGYGGGAGGTMNVGNNNANYNSAFRSMSAALKRTRTGQDSELMFTPMERNVSAPSNLNASSQNNMRPIIQMPNIGRQNNNMNNLGLSRPPIPGMRRQASCQVKQPMNLDNQFANAGTGVTTTEAAVATAASNPIIRPTIQIPSPEDWINVSNSMQAPPAPTAQSASNSNSQVFNVSDS